jgi:hypothetical protein
VVAEAADYRADASRLLERLAGVAIESADAACYGIALGEWSERPAPEA